MNDRKKVLLPQPIESEAVETLRDAGVEVASAPDPSPETVAPLIGDVHGIVLRTGIKITRELFQKAAQLQVVSRTGGGLDNVDIEAATGHQVIVTSNLGINTSSVVEHALALMLALSKQLPTMDRAVRRNDFRIRYKNLPRDLQGKTLGLLGFGRIGSALAQSCRQSFGMRVISHDPFIPQAVRNEYQGTVDFVEPEVLFSKCDVLSIHTPLTDDTYHAVGAKQLALMRPEAILINTSRGPVIDQAALCEALKNRRIAGAGLDVFEKEPIPENDPLLGLDNVIITPHTAALTWECVVRMAVAAAECVLDVFNGRVPPNVANPRVLEAEKWRGLARST